MSKYKSLTRDRLEELVIEKLAWFLKYLEGQATYPMGKFPTGIYSHLGGEYLIWVGCTKGTISFTLQDTAGYDYHNIKIDKFGGDRQVVEVASRVFKESGDIWFEKSFCVRCDWEDLKRNPPMYLKQLLRNVRKKDQVLAYWHGLSAIQDCC